MAIFWRYETWGNVHSKLGLGLKQFLTQFNKFKEAKFTLCPSSLPHHFVFDQQRRPSRLRPRGSTTFRPWINVLRRFLLKPRVLHLPQRPFQLRHGRILGNRRIGSCGPESKPPIIYSSRGMQGATVGFVRLRINVLTSLGATPTTAASPAPQHCGIWVRAVGSG